MTNYVYYISSGELNKLYTLRRAYIRNGKAVSSEYLCNLGNDHKECVQKAKEYIKNQGHDPELLQSSDPFKLGQIVRDGSSKHVNRETRWANAIKSGIVPFGKYRGQRVEDIMKSDIDYLVWVWKNSGSAQREAFGEHGKKLEEIVFLQDAQAIAKAVAKEKEINVYTKYPNILGKMEIKSISAMPLLKGLFRYKIASGAILC